MITLPVHLRVGDTTAEIGTITPDTAADVPRVVFDLLRAVADHLDEQPGGEAPT